MTRHESRRQSRGDRATIGYLTQHARSIRTAIRTDLPSILLHFSTFLLWPAHILQRYSYTMAEVFGLAAAGIGVAPLAFALAKTIKKLKDSTR